MEVWYITLFDANSGAYRDGIDVTSLVAILPILTKPGGLVKALFALAV